MGMRAGRSWVERESSTSRRSSFLMSGRSGERVGAEVAADDVVSSDRSVLDRTMHVGVGQAVALGCRDPGVEDLVARPDGDDDRVAAVGWCEDEFGADAVLLSHGAVLFDPCEVARAFVVWDIDGAPADDH